MATYLLVTLVEAVATPGTQQVDVQRALSATGPWITIGQATVMDGTGYFYDNTVPLDTPVWYQSVEPGTTTQVTPVTGPFTLVSSGTVILSDPLRPWADLEFGFCASPQNLAAFACAPNAPDLIWSRFGERVSRSDAGLFDVLDAERPADVYARRKDHEGSFLILSKSLAAIQSMYELFTAGGPLYLRAPAEYGDFNFAVQPGDLTRTYLTDRIDQRKPLRLWSAPYTVVDLPLGPQQGVDCATWCDVEAAFPTFADMTAAGGTWADIATGATVCP